MKLYEVTVLTSVKEIYEVEANNAREAEEVWADGKLISSECIGIEDVGPAFEVEEEWK